MAERLADMLRLRVVVPLRGDPAASYAPRVPLPPEAYIPPLRPCPPSDKVVYAGSA